MIQTKLSFPKNIKFNASMCLDFFFFFEIQHYNLIVVQQILWSMALVKQIIQLLDLTIVTYSTLASLGTAESFATLFYSGNLLALLSSPPAIDLTKKHFSLLCVIGTRIHWCIMVTTPNIGILKRNKGDSTYFMITMN